MKTITISPREETLNELLRLASEENLILKTDDGHEYILAEIEDFEREIELTRQNEELMHLLDTRGHEKATISLEQARANLNNDKELRVDS